MRSAIVAAPMRATGACATSTASPETAAPAAQAAAYGLAARLVRLQGDGDHAGTRAFFERYARLDEHARQVLASMRHIQPDIQPDYPDEA